MTKVTKPSQKLKPESQRLQLVMSNGEEDTTGQKFI